jgi:YD repeat-containing protein
MRKRTVPLALLAVLVILGSCNKNGSSLFRGAGLSGGASRALTNSPSTTASIIPCPRVVGNQLPDYGSGACTGNYQTRLTLPTVGVLVHNSLFAAPTEPERIRGFGNGFELEGERFIRNNPMTGYSLENGSRTVIPLLQTGRATFAPTDARQTRSTFSYSGTAFAEFGADGTVYNYSPYTGGYRVTKITDVHGQVTTIQRDGTGKLLSVTDSEGRRTTFNLDATGRFSTIVDAAGSTYRLEYDPAGNLTSVKLPGGSDWVLGYGPGGIVSEKAPDGTTSQIAYRDTTGVISAFGRNGFGTVYDYNPSAVTITDSFHRFVENFANGRVISDSLDGVTTTYVLDTSNRVTDVSGPAGTKHITYNTGYEVASVQDTLTGNVTLYTYDANHNVASVTTRRGKVPHVISYTWNSLHLPTTVTLDSKTVTYTYNAYGDLLSVTNPLNDVIFQATYDSKGNPLSTTDRFNRTTNYRYSYGSQTSVTVTDPIGRTTTLAMNSLGLLTNVNYPNGSQVTRSLNALGREEGAQTIARSSFQVSRTISREVLASGALARTNTSVAANGKAILNQTIYFDSPSPNLPTSAVMTGYGGKQITSMDSISGAYGSVVQDTVTPALGATAPN